MSLFSKALFGVIDRAFAGIFRTAREDRGLRDALRDLHARLGEELLRARALVKGKTLLMIGGEARADAVRSLEEKLRFKEVVWKETHAHRPIEPLQLEISKDEIDIVAVLVRFGDHAFSTLRKTANRHGKVFLHLPAGYNPNQVAHQIIEQADRQLSS